MNRLKKVCLWILSLPLLVGSLSCSKRPGVDWLQDNKKIKVLSTTAQIGDLVRAIGGDRVDGWVLIQGELDPHSYEIVKGDGDKLARADIIFYNGLGLEHGASLAAILRDSTKAIPIGEKIAEQYPELILKKGDLIDPHIWMDISLWEKGTSPIVQRLTEIDPEGAEYYQGRADELKFEMRIAHNEVREQLQKIPSEKRYLITSHDAFHYFTRSYLADPEESNWMERFAAPEGLAPEGQLNPKDIKKIIEYMKNKRVSVLFPESNVSRDSIRKIAQAGRELGLEIKICSDPLYGDSMNGLLYLQMMRQNANTIANHL